MANTNSAAEKPPQKRAGSSLIKIARWLRHGGKAPLSPEMQLVKKSSLFNAAWYLKSYEDVQKANVNPLLHYVQNGGFESRNPSQYFDSAWYLSEYRDIKAAGYNPLVHFLQSGHTEGRLPLPPEVLVNIRNNKVYDGLDIKHDLTEDIDFADALKRLRESSLFDPKWYVLNNPDLANADIDPARHYLSNGASEGRSPSPRFDAVWYTTANPKAAKSGINPLVHYLRFGQAEGFTPTMPQKPRIKTKSPNPQAVGLRGPKSKLDTALDPDEQLTQDIFLIRESDLFNEKWYLKTYTSVAKSGTDAAFHYLRVGGFNGHNPSINFDSDYYLSKTSSLRSLGVNPLVHYLRQGRIQGLKPLAIMQFEEAEERDRSSIAVEMPSSKPWPLDEEESHLYIERQQIGVAPLPMGATKKSAQAAFSHILTPVLALCCLSGVERRKSAKYRYQNNGKPVTGAFDAPLDLGKLHTLANGDYLGRIKITDAWLDTDYDLRLRLDVGAQALDGFGNPIALFIRAYQFHASAEASLNTVGQSHFLPEGIGFFDVALVNPYMPVLFVVTNDSGAIVDAMFLPFPALCRGGAYHAELSHNTLSMHPFEQLQLYSDSLMHEWIGADDFAPPLQIGTLQINSPTLTGAERLLAPSYLAWLNHAMHLPCAPISLENIQDGDVGQYIRESLSIGDISEDTMACIEARTQSGTLTLTLSGNALPSLCALTSRRMEIINDKATGSFISCDGISGKARCVVSLPALNSDLLSLCSNENSTYPYLTQSAPLRMDEPVVDTSRAIPVALHFQSVMPISQISQAFPHVDGASSLFGPPLSSEEKASINISVIVSYNAGDDLIAFSAALRAQTLSTKIHEISFVRKSKSSRDSSVEKGLDAFFGNTSQLTGLNAVNLAFEKTVAKSANAYVLLCDASVIMTHKRTLECLYHLSKLDNVATSSCVIMQEKVVRNVDIVSFGSGGYFPSHLSLTNAGGVSFRQLNCLEALPDTTYPVVANTFRLTLVKAEIWQELKGLDTRRFPGPFQDLDFCLRAVKAGYRHLCTSSVRAIMTSSHESYTVSDGAAESFLPVMQWQDVIRSSTIIREFP
ncbi:hypothetical protein MMA231_03461 (plasmid) [Asticcacaulis sp. MM231]|uniref:glycosyltransferase family 2 protein n=1 Tax=Asticcacaulis sp. MM231 TaxID=3157666 RepID=UPI0032D5A196